jgi:hypothetical protein
MHGHRQFLAMKNESRQKQSWLVGLNSTQLNSMPHDIGKYELNTNKTKKSENDEVTMKLACGGLKC